MRDLPSAEFRRTYATLTEPVRVTVNGHPIGTYQPISTAIDSRAVEAIRPGEPRVPPAVIVRDPDRYDLRMPRPVPKGK